MYKGNSLFWPPRRGIALKASASVQAYRRAIWQAGRPPATPKNSDFGFHNLQRIGRHILRGRRGLNQNQSQNLVIHILQPQGFWRDPPQRDEVLPCSVVRGCPRSAGVPAGSSPRSQRLGRRHAHPGRVRPRRVVKSGTSVLHAVRFSPSPLCRVSENRRQVT